jgi:hypothetical protein
MAAALAGEPWAVSAVLYALESVLDEEGRPVGERRATSAAKTGVPIELRACPYHDERKGNPMNVSALAQITRHLVPVCEEIAKVRSWIHQDDHSWIPMFMVVIDQLSGPARFLLERRESQGPIPVLFSVGHKLAAGYFGVVRNLVEEETFGITRPISTESLMNYVHKNRSLIGASEVCAGPTTLIERVTNTLLYRTSESVPVTKDEERRLAMATKLANQVRLGMVWEHYDQRSEHQFFQKRIHPGWLRPRNHFIGKQIEERIPFVSQTKPTETQQLIAAIPKETGTETYQLLNLALLAAHQRTAHEHVTAHIERLCTHNEGALPFTEHANPQEIALDIAVYLGVYRAFLGALWKEERELRLLLGYDIHVPLRCTSTILPLPKTLHWYEALLGHRLECKPTDYFALGLENHRRKEIIFANVPATSCSFLPTITY